MSTAALQADTWWVGQGLLALGLALGSLVRGNSARRVLRSLAYVVGYTGTLVVGRAVVLPATDLALVWPAAGVAVLWLLGSASPAVRRVDTVLLLVTTVLAHALLGVAVLPSLCFGLSNVAVAWSAVLVCRRGRADGRPVLETVRDLAVLGVAALVAGLVSAPFGALSSWLLVDAWSAEVVWRWVIRNGCGVLLVVAVVLALEGSVRHHPPGASWRSRLVSRQRSHVGVELLVASVVSAGVGLWVFWSTTSLSLAFLGLLTSAYVGSRFSPLVSTVHTVVLGAVVVAGAAQQRGSFAPILDTVTRSNVVQLYLVSALVVALTYSLATRERAALLRALTGAEAAARRQSQVLGSVTHGMSEGVVVLDQDGAVVLENPVARALALPGSDPGRRGLRDYGFLDLEGHPVRADLDPHPQALAQDRPVTTDLLRHDAVTGQEAAYRVTVDPVTPDVEGLSRLAVVRFHDVTSERTQIRNLEAFAGVAAHDLQAPLAAVIGWTEHLQDQGGAPGAGAETVEVTLGRIRDAGEQMSRLIHDLLTYATAGSAALRLVRVSLAETAAEVADLVLAGAQDGPAPAPQVVVGPLHDVRADAALVRQVLLNLLGNAVKYVAPGVTPQVSVTSALADGGMVEVVVTDNGIGIPAEARSRIFENFYRAHRELDYSGTGLGLAICARAVHRHGGTIATHAAPGQGGTSVRFTLPAATADRDVSAG